MSEGQGAIDPLHCTVGMPIEETPLRFGESIENNFFINFEGSHGKGNKIDKRSQFLYNLPFDEHICCTIGFLNPFEYLLTYIAYELPSRTQPVGQLFLYLIPP